jgi:hypothetical protein
MVSFDTGADHESIVLNKIIPFVKNELAWYWSFIHRIRTSITTISYYYNTFLNSEENWH